MHLPVKMTSEICQKEASLDLKTVKNKNNNKKRTLGKLKYTALRKSRLGRLVFQYL